jgi:uncharacterized membrane protein YphA (DoxX/SURF4 family)
VNRRLNVALWVVQVFLALFFALASGAPKFFLPYEMLNMPTRIPDPFLYFIGVCEISGGLALILPGLLRSRTGLTTLAAFMLVLLTICASVYQLTNAQPESGYFALGMGAVCALVAYGRWRLAPLRAASSRPVALAGAA